MDELLLLEHLNADVSDPAPEVVLRARRDLLAAAAAPSARRSVLRLPWRSSVQRPTVRPARLRGVPRLALAAAAAMTLAGGVLVAQAVRAPSGASAAAALRTVAEIAADQPFTPPEPDQFFYVRSDASWSSGSALGAYLQPQLYEAWLSVDGSRTGVIRKTFEAPVFLRPGDEERMARAGEIPPAGTVQTYPVPPGGGVTSGPASYAWVAALPTEPDALFDFIRDEVQGQGPSEADAMLEAVGEALTFSVAPPATRAALYEVAARIDGVEVVPGTTDLAGRVGTTVAVTTNGLRSELIFDPETADLLGMRTVVVDDVDGLEVGTVLASDSTVVTVVNDAPPAPAGELRPDGTVVVPDGQW